MTGQPHGAVTGMAFIVAKRERSETSGRVQTVIKRKTEYDLQRGVGEERNRGKERDQERKTKRLVKEEERSPRNNRDIRRLKSWGWKPVSWGGLGEERNKLRSLGG